jgi:uncharacterized delta-60 repeat protein
VERLEDRCLLAAGTLDLSFSGDGKETLNFGGTDFASGVAVQPDGKIVVVGEGASNKGDFQVVRYNPDGSVDKVLQPLDFSGGEDSPLGVAIQPWDGKIVVVGTAEVAGSFVFAVARFNADGSLDSSFSTAGVKGRDTQNFGASNNVATSVAFQSDHKIVVVGYTGLGLASNWAVARYLENGDLDPAFGAGGKDTIDFNSRNDRAFGIAVQPGDKIVLAGVAGVPNPVSTAFALVRYDGASGTLDNSFGDNGKAVWNVGEADTGGRIALESNGGILLAGTAHVGGSYNFAVLHFDAGGHPDLTINHMQGQTVIDFAGATDLARDLALEADGKIVVVGRATIGGSGDFALARLNPDGTVVNGFGADGKVTTEFGGGAAAAGVALQPADGKIVVVGQAGNNGGDFALARYENDRIQFAAAAYSAGEADVAAAVTLTRTGGVRGTVSVTLQAAGGTATPGVDYAGLPLTVAFAEGETTKTVVLPLVNDGLVEGNETVLLTLTSSRGAAAGRPQAALLTIVDNGGPAAVPAAEVSAQVSVVPGKVRRLPNNRYRQRVTLRSLTSGALSGPVVLVLDGLPRKVRLRHPEGLTQAAAPPGSPVRLVLPPGGAFGPGDSLIVVLDFANPLRRRIRYTPRVLAGNGLW